MSLRTRTNIIEGKSTLVNSISPGGKCRDPTVNMGGIVPKKKLVQEVDRLEEPPSYQLSVDPLPNTGLHAFTGILHLGVSFYPHVQ